MANEKVLIVDDDPDLTEALQTILQSRDYVVCTASNVEDGMATAKAEVPDLMIR
ncbi:MAG: response regulator, partial [Planctomycetes bacterium]|nr:response regulator [Planctomycetota bacterium]